MSHLSADQAAEQRGAEMMKRADAAGAVGVEALATPRKFNNLEDIHCVRDAEVQVLICSCNEPRNLLLNQSQMIGSCVPRKQIDFERPSLERLPIAKISIVLQWAI